VKIRISPKTETSLLTGHKYCEQPGVFIFILLLVSLLCTPVTETNAISLDQCIELALKNNPGIHKQQLNLKLVDENLTEAKSQRFGEFNLVSAYTRYNLPHTLTVLTPGAIASNPAAVPTTQDFFTLGLNYEVALFTGFTQRRTIEITSLEKELAATTFKLQKEQLIYNVKTLYVKILSLQAQRNAATAHVEALQRLYDDVTLQLELGKIARINQLKAAADLKSGQAEVERITAYISIATASLEKLLNVESISTLQTIDLPPESIVAISEDFTDQMPELERMHATDLSILKSRKFVQKTQGNLYPRISFNSSIGQNFGPNDDGHTDSGDWNNRETWQVGLNLKWNIFSFGSTRARIRRAGLQEYVSRYEQTEAKLELKRAFQEAVTRINLAVTAYNSAREEFALTQETEIIENVRFGQGAADINDLLLAKARNQLALSRFTEAGFNYLTARFYLDYLLENGENL